MKVKKLLLIPLLALGMLTSCDPVVVEDPVMSTMDILEKASGFGALLVNGSSGLVYSDPSIDVKLTEGEYLIGARTVNVKNVLLQEEGTKVNVLVAVSYSVDEDAVGNWKINLKKPDADHDRLIPSYPEVGEPTFVSTLTATLKLFYEEGQEVLDNTFITIDWTVYHRGLEIIDTTIGDMRRGITKVLPNDNVRTRGYITDHFYEGTGPSDIKLYQGVFIADGDRAVQLYAGAMSNLWFDNGEAVFKIGDLIEIMGPYFPYEGLAEIKPKTMQIVEDDSILEPVDLIIDNPTAQWNKSFLQGHDGRIVQFNNLIYVKGEVAKDGANTSLYFKPLGTNIEILLYMHANVGLAEQQALRALVATFVANTTKINYRGVLSWHKNPQLGPTKASCLTVVS